MSFVNIPRPPKNQDTTEQPKRLAEFDTVLLTELLELFSGNVINFYKHHDFNGAFRRDFWRPLSYFVDQWIDVDHEFIDPELEERRKRLYIVALELASAISKNTVPRNDGEVASVRAGWEGPAEDARLRAEAQEINDRCGPFVDECESFIRYARKRLAQN